MKILRGIGSACLIALTFVLFVAAPARVHAQRTYNFTRCGRDYTTDELGFYGGPFLQVFTPEFTGRDLTWLEPTSNYATNPDSWTVNDLGWAAASVTLTQAGEYVLIMEYTPFVYDVEYRKISSPKTESFLFIPYSVAINTATIQVVDTGGRSVPAGVDVEFPGWGPDLDPYEAVTDGSGQISLQCLSHARVTFPTKEYNAFPSALNVFVNDPTYGSFCSWVNLPGSGSTITVKVKPAGCVSSLTNRLFNGGRI